MFLVITINVCWLLLIIPVAMLVGGQLTSHEERVNNNYNLEDLELDKLANIKARLVGEEKRIVEKLHNAALAALLARQKAEGWIRKLFRKLAFWR